MTLHTRQPPKIALVPRLDFAEAVRSEGFEPYVQPLITTIPLSSDIAHVRSTILAADKHHTIFVTSKNTVLHLGPLRLAQSTARFIAVGSATAKAITTMWGVKSVLVPTQHSSAGLLEYVEQLALEPGQALLPGALNPLPELSTGLLNRGWRVQALPVYQTTPVEDEQALTAVRELYSSGKLQGIYFTSPSMVHAYLTQIATKFPEHVWAIGETTFAALHTAGTQQVIERS